MGMNYTLTKENTDTKIKASAKEDVTAFIAEKFAEAFGEDSVAMLRMVSGQSFKNALGVVIGSVDVDGVEMPISVTIDIVAKDFMEKTTAKTKKVPFDFAGNKARYDEYIAEKDEKGTKSTKTDETVARKDSAEDVADESNGF